MRDPINPADIRVGDRVERVYVSGDHETIERFKVESVAHRAVSSCRQMRGDRPPQIDLPPVAAPDVVRVRCRDPRRLPLRPPHHLLRRATRPSRLKPTPEDPRQSTGVFAYPGDQT